MIYLLKYTFSCFILILLFWLPGRTLNELLRKKSDLTDPPEVTIQFLLGTGFWICLVFILCTFGFFSRISILVSAIFVGAVTLPGLMKQIFTAKGFRTPVQLKNTEDILCVMGLLIVLLPLLVISMLPEVSVDAQTYHLTLPKRYLQQGGFHAVDFNVYSNWPLNIELLFGFAMALINYIAAKSVQWIFSGAIIIAMWAFCKKVSSRWVGYIAAAFFLFNYTVLKEIPTAYVDVAHAFYMTSAFIFMHRAVQTPQRQACLLLSGISCGLMAGIKVTAVIWSVPVALIFFIVQFQSRFSFHRMKQFVLLFCLPIAVLWAPWLIKSEVFTGNPVYPLFYDVLGGADWSSECSEQFIHWQKSIGMGRTIQDYLLLPYRVVLESEGGYDHFDGRINAAWILLAPLMLVGAFRHVAVRHALIVCTGYFILWALSSQQIRFLVPMLPIAAMGSAVSIGEGIERLKLNRRICAITRCAILCLVFGGLFYSSGEYLQKSVTAWKRIMNTPEERLCQEAVRPIYQEMNNTLPDYARVLFININHGFFCDRDYIADSFFEASQIAAWLKGSQTQEEIVQKLKQKKITHILFYRYDWKIDFPQPLMSLLREQKHVKVIAVEKRKRFYLFQLLN